jgi:ribonuclease BN (tRNA processing enzyme)
VQLHELAENPLKTEALIVSHGHLDHFNDAEALIEMMTQASDKPGALFAPESVLEGYGDIEKAVSDYHQDLCMTVKQLEEKSSFEFKDLEIESQEMFHSDPKTVGFTIEAEKKIGFWTDTEYSDELTDFYKGCDTLIVYCTRPKGEGVRNHTSVSDVPKIVEEIEVENVILTHFGQKFLNSDMEEQKEWLKGKTDAKVTFAEDGMQYPGNRSLGDF